MFIKNFSVVIALVTLPDIISSLGIHHLNFTRLPDFNEQSILASGPFIQSANTTGLRRVMSSDFLEVYNNKTILTTKVCLRKLENLVRVVKTKFHQKYMLLLLAGYTSIKWTYLPDHSLHYEGRALDLTLKKRSSSNTKGEDNAKIDRIHHRLAWLAYKKAGFNFVKVLQNHHGEHVHVSCRREQK